MEDKQFGICNLSLVPLRAEASDRSEMLSQLLFGDCFEIVETAEKWLKILTYTDTYSGWIDRKQCLSLTEPEYHELKMASQTLGPGVSHPVVKASTGELVHLLPGSGIPSITGNSFGLAAEKYSFLTDPPLNLKFQTAEEITQLASTFLNAPYLWGGKSLFGIDCSGFTQLVFKIMGYQLRRDAWQQAEQGDIVDFLQEAKTGDLAFFDNEEGKIVHVGIMLGSQKIIHASGRVKIDLIDDQGIYSVDMQKHTHRLRIIKRYFYSLDL